ncbi:MAG: DUF47 family protein [Candidatus Neomarinimicrobiota bacterium]
MKPLFGRVKVLEQKSGEFLDVTVEASHVLITGMTHYLEGARELFEADFRQISALENRGDALRREIENQLYTETLIPESRGDVLALLENIDNITNQSKQILMELSVEIPEIPTEFHADYLQLTEKSIKAVEEVINSTRTFLNFPLMIEHSLNKVYFWESEADRHSELLKRKVFRTADLELSRKFHLRYFALHIELLADRAEDVADRLAIYAIKRSL